MPSSLEKRREQSKDWRRRNPGYHKAVYHTQKWMRLAALGEEAVAKAVKKAASREAKRLAKVAKASAVFQAAV